VTFGTRVGDAGPRYDDEGPCFRPGSVAGQAGDERRRRVTRPRVDGGDVADTVFATAATTGRKRSSPVAVVVGGRTLASGGAGKHRDELRRAAAAAGCGA